MIIQKYNNTIVYYDVFPKCVLEIQSLYKNFLVTKLIWLLITTPFTFEITDLENINNFLTCI